MDLSDSKAQAVLNKSIQGGEQRYGVADGKVYEFQPDNVGGGMVIRCQGVRLHLGF